MQINSETLSPRDVYGSDPLIRVLVERLHISPARFALASVLAGFGYMGVLALAFGYLLPRQGFVASSVDTFNQLNFLFIFPAIAFYYLWQPQRIVQTYAALVTKIKDQIENTEELFHAISRMAVRKGWWLAALVLGLLAVGAGTLDSYLKLGSYWYAGNWLMILCLQFTRGLIVYMVAIIFARHLTVSIELLRIYGRFEIPSPILPPSQTYWIRAIEQYAFTFIVFSAVVGLNIGLAPVLSARVEVAYHYEAALYLILAPLGFLLPLWGAHLKMAESRSHILDDLSERYQTEYDQLLSKVAGNDRDVEDAFKRLNAIEAAYGLARKSWTWPFDTSVLLRAGVTILAPFGILLSQLLQKYVADLLARMIGR